MIMVMTLAAALMNSPGTGVWQYDALTTQQGNQPHDSIIAYKDGVLTIHHSGGGDTMTFQRAAITANRRGDKVVIDGDCVSACTQMVDVAESVALTRNARLGYHKFVNSGVHYVPNGSYSEDVMQWITVNLGWGEGADIRFMPYDVAVKFYGGFTKEKGEHD